MEVITLVQRLAVAYPLHSSKDRLKQVGLTPQAYARWCKRSDERKVRESSIQVEDIVAAVNFFVEHPDVGAGRANATLINQEKAWISTANLNLVKKELACVVSREYKQRREAEKLLEAQLSEALANQKKTPYQHLHARYCHHIWAIDFVNVTFLGIDFALCVIYDEHSQAYMAILAGEGGDQELATTAFQQALTLYPKGPIYLRRDNGKPFLTEEFQQQLKPQQDYPVPPRSPWYNGALESCNGCLKVTLKTTGMQEMVSNSNLFQKARKSRKKALDVLQGIASRVQTIFNEEIARQRYHMPPGQVLSDQIESTKKRNRAFIEKKRTERAVKMAEIRKNPVGQQPKTLIDKIRGLVRRKARRISTDGLFVLGEVLNKRFQMFEA